MGKENKATGKHEEKKAEEAKVFKAKSMTDGDLRMPKSLRARIKWLKPHTPVTFEIVELGNDHVLLDITKEKPKPT